MAEVFDFENFVKAKMEKAKNEGSIDHLQRILDLIEDAKTITDGRKKIAEHYGEAKQVLKLSEEMGELNHVLMKYLIYGNKEYPEFRKKVVEEIADVYNVLRQLIYIWNISETDILAAMAFKVDRTLKRIEREKLNTVTTG